MVWSKRKPYYGLKLSVNEFFRAPVRYLRDYVTKESILEKPYEDEDRGKMHQDPPRNPETDPSGDPEDNPPVDTTTTSPDPTSPTGSSGGDPDGDLPGVNPDPDETPIPGVNPDPDPTQGGMWVQPVCSASSDCDCLSVGESCLIFAATNEKGLKTTWGIENTDPGGVSAVIVQRLGDKVVIKVTALKEQEGNSPIITIWGSWGYQSSLYTSRCGGASVTVPCCNFPIEWDEDASEDTIEPEGNAVVAVTQGTAPYTWSVTGTGFSIEPETGSRFNLLLADETACGTATIVVTDACGSGTVGYVRSTEGRWVQQGPQNVCRFPGAGELWWKWGAQSYAWEGRSTQGEWRTDVRLSGGYGGGIGCMNCGDDGFPGGGTCPEMCLVVCGVTVENNCTECITGVPPVGYSNAGSWNCWGQDGTECEGGWTSMMCLCITRIKNEQWIC